MLTIPQLQAIQDDDPYTYEAFVRVRDTLNALMVAVGYDAAAAPQAATGAAVPTGGTAKTLPVPSAPASLAVSAARGTFNVTVGASPGAAPGILYFLEIADNTGFTNNPGSTSNVVYPLGGTLQLSINLGNVTRYFRARAKYPQSDYSGYTYLGTAANPTAVSGGQTGSADLVNNANLNETNNATVDSIDAGASATARIYGPGGVGTSWTFYKGSATTTMASGSITGLAYTTTYWVYWTGSAFAASTTTFAALPDGYIFAGKVTTVAAGGAGGVPGGGGAIGSGGRLIL